MPGRDEYEFGKHYFVLDKKVENHINAKNNPHNVKKADIGLSHVENHPFKSEWVFEEGEPDSYISSLIVKQKIDEITNKLNTTLEKVTEQVDTTLSDLTEDVSTALNQLHVVNDLLDFIYLHNNPLVIDFNTQSKSISPTPNDRAWNLIKKYLLSEDKDYLTVIVNGKFYHAYCTYDFDDTDGKESLTLKSNMAGEITININSETKEYELDLVKWYGLEEERNLTISYDPQDIPMVLEDTFVFPTWLVKNFEVRQNRLKDIESQVINFIINDRFFKAKISHTEIQGATISIVLLTSEGRLTLNYTPDDFDDFSNANWNLESIRWEE